jgi:hypothetical protein
MKTQLFKSALAATVLLGAVGCGGAAANPLVGSWQASLSSSGINGNITMTLAADGTATTMVQFTGGNVSGMEVTCTGSGVTNTGYRWTSTATTLAVTGTPMCSGASMCMVGGNSINIDCSQMMMGGMSSNSLESATYVLSNGNNTLTVTGMSGGMTQSFTFMRRM